MTELMMNKFIIVTRGRTGSTAIIDELSKVKSVHSAPHELFLRMDFSELLEKHANLIATYGSMVPFELWKTQGPRWHQLIGNLLGDKWRINQYLREVESAALREGAGAFGFKVLSGQLEQAPLLKNILRERGYRVIYLKRNIPRQVISGMIARQRGSVWNTEEEFRDEKRYRIDIEEFYNLAKWGAHAVESDTAFLSESGYDFIEVTYEEFMADRQSFFNRLLRFIDVPLLLPERSSYSIMIQDLEHTVENYQEIVECAAVIGMRVDQGRPLDLKYSVVIPVYRSEKIVGATVDRVVTFFRTAGHAFEIILVNDGSPDASWMVAQRKAKEYPEVVAINLLHNYGQHVANLCGFTHATGDYVITMDDDLQNPPEEIGKLIDKAAEGYDLVIGRFREKKHSLFRRFGSRVVGYINRKVFKVPKGLVLTNFRMIRKDVVQRVCAYKASYPYIPGLVVMFSSQRANVLVEHNKREVGQSNYNLWRIAKLVSEILFNFSSYPLRLVAGIGLVSALVSFTFSAFYLVLSAVNGTSVPGWATVVVLLSFFNGMTLFVLGMMGEYLVRLINQTSTADSYHIKEIVRD